VRNLRSHPQHRRRGGCYAAAVNDTAPIARDDPEATTFTGALMLVRVSVRAIFPNCPRYIPGHDGTSPFAPRLGVVPPEPARQNWRALPRCRPAARAHLGGLTWAC